MRVGRLKKLQIVRTLLTIAALIALIWLGVFETNRANLLAVRQAPIFQPREQLKQGDKGGGTSNNQDDDVSKVVGVATLLVLVLQCWIAGRQAGLMRRQADIAEGQRQISDRQASVAQRQTEIMASQRDISLATERAWVKATVEIAGPITVENGQISGFFKLELFNTGVLPAYIDQYAISAHPWDLNEQTSQEPRIAFMIENYKASPFMRRRVIFPQQSIIEPVGATFTRSYTNFGTNTLMGFVLTIRGAIRYDYSGTDLVHWTTFHVHVVRRPDPAISTYWQPIPTEDGTVVPVANLLVTSGMGETEAT